MKVVLTERAQSDQDAIFDYLVARSPSGARRVIEAMERSLELIGDHPEVGEATDGRGIRSIPVRNFPYLIFYRVDPATVEIIHIRHASRRSWTGR